MAFMSVPWYLGLTVRQVLGMEQEGHVGDEGGDQVGEVLSRAHRGRWRLLELQGPRGALPGLAQLDGPTHHLRVQLGEQRGGGLGLHLPHHPALPPSLGRFHPHLHLAKVLSQAPRASLALRAPKTSQTMEKHKPKGVPPPVTSTCLPSWTRMRMPVSTILLHLTDQSWKGRYWHFLSKKCRSFS